MSVTLLPTLLTDAAQVIASIDRVSAELCDLMDRLRKLDDHERVMRLQTSLNRLEEARRILEGCFR